MTADEMDALDRECAEAMGWTVHETAGCPWFRKPGVTNPAYDVLQQNLPSPTRSPADFVALLRWCAGQGWCARVAIDNTGGSADLEDAKGRPLASALAPDPQIALCRALGKWRESEGRE